MNSRPGPPLMRLALLAAFLGALAALPAPARADCVQAVYADSAFDGILYVFPNWIDVPTASLWLWECEDADPYCAQTPCAAGNLRGVTIFNFGTASGGAAGDIREVWWIYDCGGSQTARQTMSYAGPWGGIPAWTWAGNLALPNDPYAGCWGWANMFIYTDISPCPTDGATIELGPPFRNGRGAVTDACNCHAPGSNSPGATKTIRYVLKKADRDSAAPGDTVSYTIYYGKPGTTNPTTVTITDTQPPYTHWTGAASRTPDPGFDPDPGPPLRLRWTVPGLNPPGGATFEIVFDLSVDWGNGESFEPGSGDVAAPENFFLSNQAHISWTPVTTCAPTPGCCSSNATMMSVQRCLFWKLGDNDVLFGGRIGMPDDEIIYSVFIKNISDSKTWWNVDVWDTVPGELDAWSPGYGMEDACVGWTMTPTGCIAANGGRYVTGGRTVLTWRLDMPPNFTLELRWKARVRTSTPVNSTVVNTASLMARGRTGVIGGTGHSGTVKNFTYESPIVLRTTYISYVGWAGSDDNMFQCGGTQTYYIAFYPLNKATDFALYKRWCCSAAPCDTGCSAFAANGGVSPVIDQLAGTCVGGGGGDWEPGCKAERAPARFVPDEVTGPVIPPMPFNFLHKLVSNSPVIWELSVCMPSDGMDANTYAGTTSLSFAGYAAYTYPRVLAYPNNVDTLYVVNTSETVPTTVHVFSWDGAQSIWSYETSRLIFNESEWAYVAPLSNHYRIVSSDARIIIHKAYPSVGQGAGFNDSGTMAPNRENGNLVNDATPATFYVFAGSIPGEPTVAIVGNVGAAKATYEVWRYLPADTTLPQANLSVTTDLVGSAGSWVFLGIDTVDSPFNSVDNPHTYGPNYDASKFLVQLRLYKIKLTGGGPIQIACGRSIHDEFSGGSMLHAAVPAGGRTGTEFWLHEAAGDNPSCGGNNAAIQTINVFCPRNGMGIRLTSNDGYSASYTTGGQDQCVSFKAISTPSDGARRNWKVNVLAGPQFGDVVTQYICCKVGEKFYTAPFLSRGTYYDIIAPPVVYIGQSFWITVVVMDTNGSTRIDYSGITSFTSTDPKAELQGKGMSTYDYDWQGTGFEDGVKLFFYVSFYQLGLQTIIASDTLDGSIIGVGNVMVVGADVKVSKEPRFSIASSGEVVQFRICWSNYSTATAAAFTITDAVPTGTSYVPEAASLMFCGSRGPAAPTVTVAYGTASATTPGTFNTLTSPTQTAPASTRWLRWTIQDVYVFSTGCVCFRTKVD